MALGIPGIEDAMASSRDRYWLDTNSHASARLNLQHFWNQLSCGYLIHPDIPVATNAKVADVGTGTGLWPISLSTTLPPSVQLHGFDISDAQFPPKNWLPENVNMDTWNALNPAPEHLIGQYDVVNIRYFGLVVRKDNFDGLLRNLVSLLKPGGFLQWTEINIPEQEILSGQPGSPATATSAFSEDGMETIATLGVNFDWLRNLPEIFHDFGLTGARQFRPKPLAALRPMSSYLAIGGWEEFSYNVLDKRGPHPILGTGQELRQRLHEVRKEIQAGAAIEQLHYVTVGRHPAEEA
ncbi:hypothetical protein BO71DRAFT_427196 [Aspergillus ellipticus CBS 707.79]|uniref:Methyltransferase type 12 domain-containing protein n=1 Tax=Aspergillus ellipticus CBS 707.79 TaxID=1448320 RepID=A0A319DT62_9EURO|nr:hypothetical protein BO71DRAFT_427196 [Aspergillus ellipticus CBS 707.79]